MVKVMIKTKQILEFKGNSIVFYLVLVKKNYQSSIEIQANS